MRTMRTANKYFTLCHEWRKGDGPDSDWNYALVDPIIKLSIEHTVMGERL